MSSGQQQIVELMEEEDDSDEDDRKGGMKTEDINKWLTDIEDCWSEIDRITDYPRFLTSSIFIFNLFKVLRGAEKGRNSRELPSRSE